MELDELRDLVRRSHEEAVAALSGAGHQEPGTDRRLLRGSGGRVLGRLADAVKDNGPGALVRAVNKQTDAIKDIAAKIPDAATKMAKSHEAGASKVRDGLDYNTDTLSAALDGIAEAIPSDSDSGTSSDSQFARLIVEAIRADGTFDQSSALGLLLNAAGFATLARVAATSREQFMTATKAVRADPSNDAFKNVIDKHLRLAWEISKKIGPPGSTK